MESWLQKIDVMQFVEGIQSIGSWHDKVISL
jgi:hypothetical protein